jgi:hypothetical protein
MTAYGVKADKSKPMSPRVYVVKSMMELPGLTLGAANEEFKVLDEKDQKDLVAYAEQEMKALGVPVKASV